MTGVPQLMTPAELAEFLKIDTERLYQMRSKGTGPMFVKIGRDVRYRWHDVRDWLDANAHRATSAEGQRGGS